MKPIIHLPKDDTESWVLTERPIRWWRQIAAHAHLARGTRVVPNVTTKPLGGALPILVPTGPLSTAFDAFEPLIPGRRDVHVGVLRGLMMPRATL